MEIIVYNSSDAQVGVIKKFTYNGNFMQETYIDADVYSNNISSIVAVGCYITYRGTKFTIMYDSSVKRKSRTDSNGDAIIYEGVRFHHPVEEFKHIQFRDIVPNDNNIHYTSMPDFSFWAEDITDLAERLQANLDEYYGSGVWTVVVPPIQDRDPDCETELNIEISNINVFDAIKLVSDKFNTHYIIRGRQIILATAGSTLGHTFSYGKDNGLTDIKRIPKGSEDICTCLRAYGSEENLPSRYYAKFGTDFLKVRSNIALWIPNEGNPESPYFAIGFDVVPKSGISSIRYTFEWNENTEEIIWKSQDVTNISGKKWYGIDMYQLQSNDIIYIHPSDIDINHVPYKYVAPRSNILPDNIAITRLMLPCFPNGIGSHMQDFLIDVNSAGERDVYGYDADSGYYKSLKDGSNYSGEKTNSEYRLVSDNIKHDVYITSIAGEQKYGRIEKSEFFDNDDDKEKKNIYPTIEEMTALELRNAGYELDENIPDTARLDEVVDATFITDDGLNDKLELGVDTGAPSGYEDLGVFQLIGPDPISIQAGAKECEITMLRPGGGSIIHTMESGGYWSARISGGFYFAQGYELPSCVTGFEFRIYVNNKYAAKARIEKSFGYYWTVEFKIFDNIVYAEKGDRVGLKAVLLLDGTQGDLSITLSPSNRYIRANSTELFWKKEDKLEITTYDFGFLPEVSISDHADMVFSMKTGLCAGREFSAVQPWPTIDNGMIVDGKVTYKCERIFDEALGVFFPYSRYNILPGDKFVITGLDLPKAYIDAASERLLRYAILWMSNHDHINCDYELGIDRIFMAREHESAEAGSSLHDTIVEGELMHITDTGLGIDETLIISSLKIKEGGAVPEYEISLRNEISDGTIATLKREEKNNRVRAGKNTFSTKNNKVDVRVLTRRVDALENPPTTPS